MTKICVILAYLRADLQGYGNATLPRVATEMALHVLAYNLTRVMNIMDVEPLLAGMRA